LLRESAAESSTPIPVTGSTEQLYAAMEAMGWGELDLAAVVLLMERLAGI
jgi:3-hydroxyisobutyrate dehydrogenase-like beta-hydroxyacid dehydrogenase